MSTSLTKRLDALEQATGGEARYFVCYPEEGRYVLPGGRVVDGDTFAEQVQRAGRRATVIRVQYQEGSADVYAAVRSAVS